MRYFFVTVDVFTQRRFGGNPLAVFPDATGLSLQQMGLMARELNLSETAFVLPPQDSQNTCQVRIFTPAAEIPFAGHPTVGTAFVLATLERIPSGTPRISLEEGVGVIPVELNWGSPLSAHFSVAQLPQSGPEPSDSHKIAGVLGIPASTILHLSCYSCGLPYLFVELRDPDMLPQICLDLGAWRQVLADFWAPQIYVFWRDPEARDPGFVQARMFAPKLGVMEDPATGSAAAALAGHWHQVTGAVNFRVEIEQGVAMGRPSLIELEAQGNGGSLTSVQVGGTAVLVSEGWMTVADSPP